MPTAPVPAASPSRSPRVRSAHHALYSSVRWRRFRRWYLQRFPLCMYCQVLGRLRPAREVHHVFKIIDGGPAYDVGNCRALCSPCHAAETGAGR